MVEQDTIKLLRECDAGVKMGTASIDDVMPHVKSEALLKRLNECKDEHNKLSLEIDKLLDKYRDDGKDPNPIAKGMSYGTSDQMEQMKFLGIEDFWGNHLGDKEAVALALDVLFDFMATALNMVLLELELMQQAKRLNMLDQSILLKGAKP